MLDADINPKINVIFFYEIRNDDIREKNILDIQEPAVAMKQTWAGQSKGKTASKDDLEKQDEALEDHKSDGYFIRLIEERQRILQAQDKGQCTKLREAYLFIYS